MEQRTDCARFKRPSGDASVHSTILRSRSPLGSLSFSDNLTTKRQVPKGRPETTPGLDKCVDGGPNELCRAAERSERDRVLVGCCGCEYCCDLRPCCSVISTFWEAMKAAWLSAALGFSFSPLAGTDKSGHRCARGLVCSRLEQGQEKPRLQGRACWLTLHTMIRRVHVLPLPKSMVGGPPGCCARANSRRFRWSVPQAFDSTDAKRILGSGSGASVWRIPKCHH